MEYLLFIISLFIIIKSSDVFLDNSIKLSKILNIPELIIGVTIVSIGTTLPEIMVSSTSAVLGHSDISYGNALGSIICNTSLIAAISLVYKNVDVNIKDLKIPSIFFLITTLILCFNAYVFGYFNRYVGILLVVMSFLYFYILIKQNSSNIKTNNDENKKNIVNKDNSLFNIIIKLIISAFFVAISARIMTDNSIIMARNFGVSEADISLSIVAFGTSIPELMTCIQSIIKGHSDLSLGNIIGANLINLFLVIGIPILINPYKIPNSLMIDNMNASLLIDIPLFVFVMLILLIPIFIFKKTKKWQGIILLCCYFVYMYYLYKVN